VLVNAFEWDWFGNGDTPSAFAVVAVGEELLELAALSVARHSLRAYDAIQLGTALTARSADPELTLFACFDEALAAAARAEGLRPLP
jgi:predicted nucleic acid-binding protein